VIRKYVFSSAIRQSARTSLFSIVADLQSITRRRCQANMSSMLTPKSVATEGEGNESKKPIAAIAQLRSTSDKFRNLVDIATCARFAKSKGASMLFLPECFGFIGESSSQTLQEAEDPSNLIVNSNESASTGTESESSSGDHGSTKEEDEELKLARILRSIVHHEGNTASNSNQSSPKVHSLMNGLRTIARESGLWISGGGMHVAGAPTKVDIAGKDENQCRVYNTHVILDSSGALRASYRKIHLFDVCIPGKVDLRESKTTAPGTELVACDSPVGKLGITTCYDLRFPEMYTELTEKMGAQVLLVPSAFTVPTGAAHWHTLLRARAIENQCYVLAAAQYGKHNGKRISFGHSLAVDPWGKVIADAGGYPTTEEDETKPDCQTSSTPSEPPSIVTVEIDLSSIDSIRQRMPIDLHRTNAHF